jgi:hypothetical protein
VDGSGSSLTEADTRGRGSDGFEKSSGNCPVGSEKSCRKQEWVVRVAISSVVQSIFIGAFPASTMRQGEVFVSCSFEENKVKLAAAAARHDRRGSES